MRGQKLISFEIESKDEEAQRTEVKPHSDSQLLKLALDYQENQEGYINLRMALECYQKITNPHLNLIRPLQKLMEHIYDEGNTELFSSCCRELRKQVSEFPRGPFVFDIHNQIQKSIIALSGQLWIFYKKNLKKHDSHLPYLLYHVTFLYQEISYFLDSDHQNPFILPFNQLMRDALAGQNPEFLELMAEDEFMELDSLLSVELRFPLFQHQLREVDQLNQQLNQNMSDVVSKLVIGYLPENNNFPSKEITARAFIHIHQALLLGQSGPTCTRLPSLEHSTPEEVLEIASQLAMKKKSRCYKALELAITYSNYAEDAWQFQNLFCEIYVYSFSHSGLGFFKRSQFTGKTFFRTESLKNEMLRNPSQFFNKAKARALSPEDRNNQDRTPQIYTSLQVPCQPACGGFSLK